MPRRGAAGSPDYRIFETREFLRRLEKLPRRDAGAVRGKLEGYVYPQLRKDPFHDPNIRKLRSYTPDTWRYRIGRFRVFYIVDTAERTIFILTIDLRRDAYR